MSNISSDHLIIVSIDTLYFIFILLFSLKVTLILPDNLLLNFFLFTDNFFFQPNVCELKRYSFIS